MLSLPSKKISPLTEWWKGREYFNVAWRQMSASQEGLVSTVSGTQAREQPLAPEKFGADSFASVTLSATSGAKCLSPCCVSRHRNLCLYCQGRCLWLYRVQYWMWPVPCGSPWSTAAVQDSQKTLILSLDGRSCCMEDVPCKLSGCIISAQIWAHCFWANYRYTVQWEKTFSCSEYWWPLQLIFLLIKSFWKIQPDVRLVCYKKWISILPFYLLLCCMEVHSQ